jgi:hypothetical protein
MNEDIIKSEITGHQYSEREKQEAVEGYRELVVDEVHRMYDFYDQYLKQVEHKNFKSEKYDFELHNQFSFDLEQCKRRVIHAAKAVEDNYEAKIEIPDFDLLLENYQKKN